MARQDLAHAIDDLAFRTRKLRRARLAPFLVRGDRGRGLGALDQVLDLHLAARLLVRALDDDAGRIAAVGIFELVAHILWIAEIKFRADTRVAQLRDELLIIGDAVAVEN